MTMLSQWLFGACSGVWLTVFIIDVASGDGWTAALDLLVVVLFLLFGAANAHVSAKESKSP